MQSQIRSQSRKNLDKPNDKSVILFLIRCATDKQHTMIFVEWNRAVFILSYLTLYTIPIS